MKSLIQSLEVTYLLHATEDADRVREAIARFVGGAVSPELERLEGHFGNEILKGKLHLTGAEAERAFEHGVSEMPEEVREALVRDLGSYLDEHFALFLRLDKQELVSGRVALGVGDSIRVKVKPRVFLLKQGGVEFYSRLIGGP